MSALRRFAAALLIFTMSGVAFAQVAVPNTLVAGTTIKAADLNTNFTTIANHSLDRLSGGTISGNIAMDPGITIDGIDLSVALCASCSTIHHDLTLNGGGLTVNSNAIINSSGVIPALSSIYFASISASNFTTGTVPTARLGSGSATATSFLRGDNSWVAFAGTTAKVANYTAVAGDFVLGTGTFTVTLPAAASNLNAVIDVKNISTGTITIARTGGDTIDGATSQSLVNQYQSFTFISDGTSWWIR